MDDSSDSGDFSTHPNDAFFKSIFSEPEHATTFFKSHLAGEISTHVDWRSLRVMPTSFVKNSLRQIHSDLLFSVKISGREALLYLLFEHQTTVDPAMPLRLFGYVGEILNQHYKVHGLPLPAVVPYILHQGPDRWTVSTQFEDLFDLPLETSAALLPFLPKFQHALLDLSCYNPSSQEADVQMRIVLHLMKLARDHQLVEFFEWLAQSVAVQVPDNLLKRLLLYALHADSNLDAEEIYHTLSINPELEKQAMSVAQKLKAEGRSEGRSEGFWIGKIQLMEEFLGRPLSSHELLEGNSLKNLEAIYQALYTEYQLRFKQR